jgi:LysM repeat protein
MINVILLTLSSFMPGVSALDSIRLEVIDGKTYIIHRVEQKETLFSISRKYGVALIAVVESNPSASSGMEIGALIKVPYTPNNRTKTSEGIIHRVGAKETLYSISKQYGVTIDEIKSWNNLTSNGLNLGQELLIKNKVPEKGTSATGSTSTTTSASTPPVNTSSQQTHTVVAQETMYAISRKYGITVQQIKDWNGLTTNDLKPGQVIQVSPPTSGNSTTVAVIKPDSGQKPESLKTPDNSNQSTVNQPSTTRLNTITPTESVVGSDEVRETGMALLLEGTEGNRKYLAYHRSVKIGTILRVKNNTTRKEVFVRVIGTLPNTETSDVVLRVSKSALDKLGGDTRFPVEITYFK